MILFIIFKIIILTEIDGFEVLPITIVENLNNEVGKKGVALFVVYYFNYYGYNFYIDIKRETIFKMNIYDENNKSYEVGCGLWIDNRFLIFCELDDNIPKGQYLFQFNEKFNYSKYEIHLTSNEFKITKIDSNKVDIYLGNQTINVVDNKENYELKFKIISYNHEQLYFNLFDLEPLDCKIQNDELICLIKKTFLEYYYFKTSGILEMNLIYFNEKGKKEELYLIGNVIYNFNVQKVDVYVKITKLLTHNIDNKDLIVYETNVTNIPSVLGFPFYLNFTGKKGSLNITCLFKKGVYNPLLLFCKINHEGVFLLKEIESEIRLNNINAKYYFIIQPVKNNKIITIINSNYALPIISSIYPSILNFNEKNSFEINLLLMSEGSTSLDGITFNEKAKDLNCEYFEYKIKCKVSKEHFKGLNNEYYYIKYNNPNFNNKTTSFVTNPIKIILPKTEKTSNSNNNQLIVIISIIASVIVFIIIVLVVIVCICKNKKSDLKEEVLKTPFKDIDNEE